MFGNIENKDPEFESSAEDADILDPVIVLAEIVEVAVTKVDDEDIKVLFVIVREYLLEWGQVPPLFLP